MLLFSYLTAIMKFSVSTKLTYKLLLEYFKRNQESIRQRVNLKQTLRKGRKCK